MDETVEAAKKKARESGKRIEIPERNTETSTLFANPDGKTLRTDLYTEPVRVKKAAGEGFAPIDTTLVQQDGVIKPKAIKGDLTLSAGADTTVLKSKNAQGTAEIAAPGGKLPKPTLAGNTATYRSAYGKSADLVVTTTPTGFRQKIVVRERPNGPVTFRVPVDLPKGRSFGKNAAGQPTVLDQDGKKILDIRPVPLLDATAADANAPIDAGKVGKATVGLEADGSALVYTPDAAFLADPSITYPVTLSAVDSDWWECTIGETPCTSPVGGEDTFVNNDIYYDSWNNFNLDRILVGKSNSGAVRWRSYIRFPDIAEDSPLRNSTVQNADLILWNHLSNDCGDHVGSGVVARRVTSPWNEMTMQWTSQPSVTNTGQDVEYGAYSPNCTRGYMDYEHDLIHYVNGIVQDWADGEPNYGFQLAAGNESDITNWRRYRTQEYYCCSAGAHPPKLTVDFEPAPKVLTYFSHTGPPLTTQPTYEQAVALHTDPVEGEVPSRPGVTEAEALAYEKEAITPYEIGPDKLQPLADEDWSGSEVDDENGGFILGDDTPPTLTDVTPARGATDTPLTTQIRTFFSERVWDPELTVKDPAGNPVTGAASLDGAQKILTFVPTNPLAAATRYTVQVSNAGDEEANTMATDTWSFTTVAQAHWKFDEGAGAIAADSSGHGHDATLSDSTTWGAGKQGSGVSNMAQSPADIVASREAVRLGKAVEVADETTATRVTYAQPDGRTYKTEVTAGPVRTRQGSGWVPIDPSLVEQDGVLKPKAIASGLAVVLTNGRAGAFVSMTAADGQSYALSWPTSLPKPTVKENVATYTDAAGKGADLVVTVLPTGFRHDVVLRERPAEPLEFRIGVDTGGLTLSEDKGGRLLLTSRTGKKTVASAPQPVMWETAGEGRAERVKIATEVVTGKDGRTELVLRPDHGFLTDPRTRYPVRVDPTTTLPFNHDVDVWSTNSSASPADPTSPFMLAGRYFGDLGRTHLRFDTASLAGTNVTQAKLALTNVDAQACGSTAGAGVQVRRLTSTWNENNLHWANKPSSTTEDAQTTQTAYGEGCPSGVGTMEWTITGITQDWAGGAANHGLVLMHPNEANTTDNYRVFASSEDYFGYGPPPTLTVTTTGPASAPAITSLTATPSQVVNGTTTITSLTPQLAGTVTDTAGGNLTAQFEIEHDPAATGQGTGQIWTGSVDGVASGTQAAVTVPAGELTDGWKVRWRARVTNTATTVSSPWSDWQALTVDPPDPVSEPAVGALQVTPSQQVEGSTVTSTLTPALLVQVNDPAGRPMRAEAEIEHDPAATGQGAGQIWAGGVDNVQAGTQANITVPANRLTDGWKLRWRARAVSTTAASAWSDWQQVTVDVTQPGEEPLAQTTGPVIRTDQSFTAAAWLRWSDKEGDYTVLEQRGTHQAPFRLGNTPDRGLVFTFTSADDTDATVEGVLSDVEPPVGEWFHLVGTYDAAADTSSLYLNGDLVTSSPISFAAWNADTAMALGDTMRGDLDEVWIAQRALSGAEIATAYADLNPPAAPQSIAPATSSAQRQQSVSGVTAAANEFPYDRHSVEGCEEARRQSDGDDGDDYVWGEVRPYSGCTSRFHSWLIFTLDVKTTRTTGRPTYYADADWLYFSATFVIHTYAGDKSGNIVMGATPASQIKPRDIAVWTHIDPIIIDDDYLLEANKFTLSVDAKPTKSGGSCTSIDGYTTRSDSLGEFDDDGWDEFRFRSSGNWSDYCTIRPWFKFDGYHKGLGAKSVELWDIPRNRTATRDNAAKIRCDSSYRGNKVTGYRGGCTIIGANPIYTMVRSDPWKGQVAQHVHKALYLPNQTVPQFRDGAGNIIAKSIPGRYGTLPLTFVPRKAKAPDGRTIRGKNRYQVKLACNQWFPNADDDELPDANDIPGELQCDEFPFASTHEGAWSAGRNFSVQALSATDNGRDGIDLGIFYARYRLTNNRPFWISIK